MQGLILYFDPNHKTGVIRSKSGNRLNFSTNDWKASEEPRAGLEVDFVEISDTAKEIFLANPESQNRKKGSRISKLAIAALAIGIVSAILFIVVGPFGPVAAIACGHIAIIRVRKSDNQLAGFGIALAGLILGYVGLLLFILTAVLMIIAIPLLD